MKGTGRKFTGKFFGERWQDPFPVGKTLGMIRMQDERVVEASFHRRSRVRLPDGTHEVPPP